MLLVTGPTGNFGQHWWNCFATRDRPAAGGSQVAIPTSSQIRWAKAEPRPSAWTSTIVRRGRWPSRGYGTLFLLFPLPSNRTARNAILPFLGAAQKTGLPARSALKTSAMDWTILQCGFFMQNLHRAISTHGIDIVECGELFIPAGAGRTSCLDARDAADVAATVLKNPECHRNRVYRLTGPAALTMGQVAQALPNTLRYRVRYTHPNLITFASRLRCRGVRWDTSGLMSAVYTLTRFGRNQPITDEVEQLLERPPRTLQGFPR